jgi:hypothetical protein
MNGKTILLSILFSFSHFLYGQINGTVKQAIQLGDSLKFRDAITLLKTEIKNNPDDAFAYYWLGRYSHYLVYDSRPFTQKGDKWSKIEVLANLKKAIQLNPKLGDAYYFLAVEYGARAREAIENSDIVQAKKELRLAYKAGSFPDYILEYARNILKACDKNAILFTNQDPSVNTLMYLQLEEGVRKDVSVIAVNLLERPFYVKEIRDGIRNEIASVPISWNNNLIMNMYSYFPWKEQNIKIEILPQKRHEYKIGDTVKEFTLPVKGKFGSDAMWIGTAAILNILENNKFKRPIYCAMPNADDMFEFTDYLQNEGFVSKFMPYRVKDSIDEFDTAKFKSSILNRDNYKHFGDTKFHDQPRADYFFADNRRYLIIDYIKFLIALNMKEEARAVYLKMDSLMPTSDHPLSKDIKEKCKKIERQLMAN